MRSSEAYQPPPPRLWYNPMAEAAFTAPPVLFEPPPELTWQRHEVWVAAAGGAGWGGCEVHASINDQTYDQIGVILVPAVVGRLTSVLSATQDPDTSSAVTIDLSASRGALHPGSPEDADLFVTLCRVGSEFIAYSASTLVGSGEYRLDRFLRRGVFGTAIEEHPAGEPFVRLNQALFRHPYPAHLVGRTIHLKFPAFNEFYQMRQGLDQVAAYSLVLTGTSAG
jgi:hypothetical protein